MTAIGGRIGVHLSGVQPAPPSDQTTDNSAAAAEVPASDLPAAGLAGANAAALVDGMVDQSAAMSGLGPRGIGDALLGMRVPDASAQVQSAAGALQAALLAKATEDRSANPVVTTLTNARLDGSVVATKLVDDRPDAQQNISAGVTPNQSATAASAGAEVKDRAPSTDANPMVDQEADKAGTPDPRSMQTGVAATLDGSALTGAKPDDGAEQFVSTMADRQLDAAETKTGIVASGILNAAMTPGWPQAQPLHNLPVQMAAQAQGLDQGMQASEMLTYLANLGADEKMLAQVKKLLEGPAAGRKMVFYLASLATALQVVFKSLAGELETIMQEDAETAEGRKRANARGKKTRRDRLYLE